MALGGISKIVDVLSDYDLQFGTGVSEMAQRAKTIAAKSDALSPTPGIPGRCPKEVFALHMCTMACLHSLRWEHTHNNKIMNNKEIT